MHRSVEQQISAFALVHDSARKQYLYTEWTSFLERAKAKSSPGTLTSFLSDLQRAEVTSVFVPKRLFRQLSPNNPYAAAQQEGHHEEVRPTDVALRLIACREQLAEYWVELLPSLSLKAAERAEFNATAASNATAVGDCLSSYDKQLLLGMATKLAARQMLNELSLRPSCRHLHEWLSSYLLVQNANELTALGSVERLHAGLCTQPICIRGGAIVDPLDISLELFQRSVEVLELMESDLREAPAHIVPLTSGFLESCLRM